MAGNLTAGRVWSPVVGGGARARELAKRINATMSMVDKRREKAGEVAVMTVIGDETDKTCVIVDEICDTAGTLCKAAEVLMENGAKEVHSYITHGVLSDPAVTRVGGSALESLVVTDSIPLPEGVEAAPNIRAVSVAPMLAQAILNVANHTSVSSLFNEETLQPIYEAFYRFD